MYINKINSKANTLIISHADLDGVSSALLLAKELESRSSEYSIKCHMSPVAGMTDKLLKEYSEEVDSKNVQIIYILDRASDITVLNNIRKYFPNVRKVYIFDHHISQKNFYDSIKALSYGYQIETYIDYDICTTRIISRYFGDAAASRFATLVDLWDTFKWKENPESESAKLALKLNAYLGILGPLTTYDTFSKEWQNILEAKFESIEGLNIIWSAYENKIQSEIDRITPQIQYMNLLNTKTNECCVLGFVPVHVDGDVLSMVYNKILDEYRNRESYTLDPLPTILFGVGDNGTISVRVSDTSPVSALEFVRLLDESSGGHKNAAGGNIAPAFSLRNVLHNMLFSSKRLLENTDYLIKNYEFKNLDIDLGNAVNNLLSKTTFTAKEVK